MKTRKKKQFQRMCPNNIVHCHKFDRGFLRILNRAHVFHHQFHPHDVFKWRVTCHLRNELQKNLIESWWIRIFISILLFAVYFEEQTTDWIFDDDHQSNWIDDNDNWRLGRLSEGKVFEKW